jgi:hypothetical protein
MGLSIVLEWYRYVLGTVCKCSVMCRPWFCLGPSPNRDFLSLLKRGCSLYYWLTSNLFNSFQSYIFVYVMKRRLYRYLICLQRRCFHGLLALLWTMTCNLVSHKGALISHKMGVNSTLSLTSLRIIHWNKISFPWAPWGLFFMEIHAFECLRLSAIVAVRFPVWP